MLAVYAAWAEGAPESDVSAICGALNATERPATSLDGRGSLLRGRSDIFFEGLREFASSM